MNLNIDIRKEADCFFRKNKKNFRKEKKLAKKILRIKKNKNENRRRPRLLAKKKT
ncbi:MAG: hypothetical protein AAB396_02440 [Patescibacteria group bacterium]